jgi:type IV secretion system protein VirB11
LVRDERTAANDSLGDHVEMLARYLGAAVMLLVEDPDVTELRYNPGDVVRVNTLSRGRRATDVRLSPANAQAFLNAVADAKRLTLDASRPEIQAELPPGLFRGARLQGFVAPVTSGPAFVLRKPPARVITLGEYVAQGVLTTSQRGFLELAVLDHENVLVAGGTGTGKTTLVNALLEAVARLCPEERVVLLEDTVELLCPVTDQIALRTHGELDLFRLLVGSLRLSPDRIIVGEVRDHSALALLDAWSTGHPGGFATLHANHPEAALDRLDRLARRAAQGVPQHQLVAETVQLVVMLQGDHGRRHVTSIARVRGTDAPGRYALEPVTAPAHAAPKESA